MVKAAHRAPWPGGSDAAWLTASESADPPWSPAADRRTVPNLGTAAAFRRHVRTPASEGSRLATTFGGVLAAVIVLYQVTGLIPPSLQRSAWPVILWLGVVAAAVTAVVGYVRGTSTLPFASERARVRMLAGPHVLGRAYPARSSTAGRAFHVDDTGADQQAVVVLDTALGADSARRLLRAFDVWFSRLDGDDLAYRAAQLRFGSAMTVTSEEIFGEDAVGGYLVRDPEPSVPGWRLLIAGRHDRGTDRPYRRGEVLTVPDEGAANTEHDLFALEPGYLIDRITTGIMLFAAIAGWVWFAGQAFVPGVR